MLVHDILSGISMQKIFIHTNIKQEFGALLSKFSFKKFLPSSDIAVEIINIDKLGIFKNFVGKKYKRKGFKRLITFSSDDLQSFTLSRFMPPELMNFSGRALVVDPDVFAVSHISELLSTDMRGRAIMACRKKDAWDTSVMLLDCSQLKHWRIEDMLQRLTSFDLEYTDLMTLEKEKEGEILEIGREWNDLDNLTPRTKIIHITKRLTQPWKTGLPIDFTRNPMPKIFGLIPREPVHKLLGKYPTHYEPHPNKKIEQFFFKLTREALDAKELSREKIQEEILNGNIREDFFDKLLEIG